MLAYVRMVGLGKKGNFMYLDVLNELNGKRVKIDGETQLITVDIRYSLKYNCNSVEIQFNKIIKTDLGRHLNLCGYMLASSKDLKSALYYLFNNPHKQLSEKQEKVLNRIIKKYP